LIYRHKERVIDTFVFLTEALPAAHYVMVDDSPTYWRQLKSVLGAKLTTG